MTIRSLAVLALLLLSAVAFAAVPIASIEPRIGEMPFDDISARSTTDAQSTLAVWANTYRSDPYNTVFSSAVYGAFLNPDGEPESTSFLIRGGMVTPHVATNGQQFVVAYAAMPIGRGRGPIPTVGVRVVERNGSLGPEQTVSTYNAYSPAVTGLLWAEDHWILSFYSYGHQLAFLGPDLQPKYPTLQLQSAPRLVQMGKRRFAIQQHSAGIHASELVDGTLGSMQSFAPTTIGSLFAVATPSGVLAVIAGNSQVEALAFSPSAGWSTPRALTTEGIVRDVAPHAEGAVLLHGTPQTVAAMVISDDGLVLSDTPILTGDEISDVHLGSGAGGPLLLVSIRQALFAYPFDSRRPLLDTDGHLVSIARFDRQTNPVVASTGSQAVVFWNQTVSDTGEMAGFARRVDSGGSPSGDPIRLPFTLGASASAAYHAGRIVIVWNGSAVSVDANTLSASPVVHLPGSIAPRTAGGSGGFFAVWLDHSTSISTVYGTELNQDGTPVTNGFPLLPSFRAQSGTWIAPLADQFVTVGLEDYFVEAVVHSAGGTPSVVHSLREVPGGTPAVAGDSQGAVAAWLSTDGAPVFSAFDRDGKTESLKEEQRDWGAGYQSITIVPAGTAGRYLVALGKGDSVTVLRIQTIGSRLMEQSTIQVLRGVASPFAFSSASGTPIAVFEENGRVWVAAPQGRRRAVRRD